MFDDTDLTDENERADDSDLADGGSDGADGVAEWPEEGNLAEWSESADEEQIAEEYRKRYAEYSKYIERSMIKLKNGKGNKKLRVLFLDVDGVLNSDAYDRSRDLGEATNIDVTRLPLLKEIVDKTGALIVLTSSWRRHWDPDPSKLDASGKYLCDTFAQYGLKIYGKTSDFGKITARVEEIEEWVRAHRVATFAILDDYPFGWGELIPFLVKTSPHGGRGLEPEHVQRAIEILKPPKPKQGS